MRALRRHSRILILCFLSVSVLAPIFLLSYRLKHIKADVSEEYIEDLSIIKHRTEAHSLSAIEQEEVHGLREPTLLVYKDDTSNSTINFSSSDDTRIGEVSLATDSTDLPKNNATRHDKDDGYQKRQPDGKLPASVAKEESHAGRVQQIIHTRSRMTDEKVKEMKDQVIRARTYLNFTPSNSSSHFVKELKLRIKELERAVSQSTKDSHISRSSLQKMKAMESTLAKASRIYPDCAVIIKKLRAMTYSAEEQVRSQRNQESFLRGLGGRTISKGFHCLSMRLTAEYFALKHEDRELPNKHKLQDPRLYHFALFSDNVLACAVVVNSTISTAREPGKVVFHIVTDSLNVPAISMWFLSNPPGKATVHVESVESFQWLATKYNATLEKEGSVDPRYTSELNHLRFYLPDVFPRLNKIVFLDHDVVVKKDLTRLWSINMRGKVNGAVETCKEGEPSFHRMDMLINFTDPMVATKFDAKTCTWAFGMNLFDLHGWRQRNLTGRYHKYLHLGNRRPLWKAGSLPIGWVTFYKDTFGLDKSWHVLGLGYDSGVRLEDIDRASVVHFDGILKPWLDIGIERHKHLWKKHVKYEHPFLQQCNLHAYFLRGHRIIEVEFTIAIMGRNSKSTKMATITACTSTSSLARAALVQKASAARPAPPVLGLPSISKMGRVRCSLEEKTQESEAKLGMGASMVAAACAAAMSSPAAMALVKFRLVMFRPFVGEVILAQIKQSREDGIQLTLGFFDDIYIPVHLLLSETRCEHVPGNKVVWIWKYQEMDYHMIEEDEVRFKVHSVSYPPVPKDHGQNLEQKDVKPFSPMVITKVICMKELN
ncbi:galacturonosyltransferase 6 [Perilla frutescens var. hirtella]|uniref:PSII 6.1 kDa protein n=1 Tax=Perilla frutescens var. hirtella TaxID=608512 RepID=A0AAD4IYT9_PERFH|nr:galacturonosyltransferase 6 [Perilla frutescens var. hirtella]